jgi:hypothetical protein
VFIQFSDGAIEERFLRSVARRANTARKKKQGYSGQNDRCTICGLALLSALRMANRTLRNMEIEKTRI